MAAFTDYRGLKRWIPAPSGPAGIVLNDNFTEIADRSGPVHSAAANPTVNDDQDDTAGNGKFYKYSKWLNTGTTDLYICIDSTATAAVWNRIHYNNITDPDINNSLTIDSTQVLFLPAQASFNGTIIVGDGGGALVHNAGAEGKYNVALGIYALKSVTTGDSNVAVGDSTLEDVTTGIRNLALGFEAQNKCISGQYNVAVGDEVLYTNTVGNRNVCIGTRAGHAILGDDNVCIGHHAGENEVGSDKLYIDCTDTATPLIYGEFNNDLVKINGDLIVTDTIDAPAYNISDKKITVAIFTSAGINTAINDLGSDGGEVYLPEGDYDCTTSIVLSQNNITIKGAGKGTRLLATNRFVYDTVAGVPVAGETLIGDTNGYTATCIQVDITNKIVWYSDLNNTANFNNGEVISWSGGADTTISVGPTEQNFNAIAAASKDGCIISDLYLIGGKGGGSAPDALIYLNACTDFTVQNCWIIKSDSAGLISTNGVRTQFERIIADDNEWTAIGIQGTETESIIQNCIVKSGIRGIRLCGTHLAAVNNRVSNTGADRGLLLCSGNYLMAAGNTFNNARLDIGCYYADIKYVLVADNIFYGSGLETGIVFIGTMNAANFDCLDCIVKDNIFHNLALGVTFDPEQAGALGVVERNIIQDNKFVDCTTAITLVAGEDVNNNSLIMNTFQNCGTDISDNGTGTKITSFDEATGNVGINEVAPQDKLEVNGTGLFKGRVKLTQDDGNEYIEGVNDNYIDIGATTAIRNNAAILATNKVMFTQIDGDEYIDSLNDGFVDYGATTAHRFLNDIKITQDNDKLYFGIADDVSITYSGTKWIFDIEVATDLITMNPDGDDTDFVFGSSQLNDTGVVAQDSRMFFNKGNGAFRAGVVTGAEWNSTGYASFACGCKTSATGGYSTCFGLDGAATGTASTVMGFHGAANKYGQCVNASGVFVTRGDAQGSTFTARKSVVHSDANWYPLFLDGTDDQMTLASDAAWTFSVLLVGTTSGCTKTFGFKIEGVIENDGGTTTILASNVTTLYDADDTDFDARVVADDATDALEVEVTDATSGGDTVRWFAKVSTAEVTF